MDIEKRIEHYWDKRSADFSLVRRRELDSADAAYWLEYIEGKLSARSPLKILDAGTGAGFFALLMAGRGHEVTGIDLSKAMLERARRNAFDWKVRAAFREMNAQRLEFDDETFDAVISRNLTWILPDVETAYREWRRVLKVGGVLLNFDSDYGDKDFGNVVTCSRSGVDEDQLDECGSIKNALKISDYRRPSWDVDYLQSIGFEVSVDEDIAPLVHRDDSLDFDRIALFAIAAVKK